MCNTDFLYCVSVVGIHNDVMRIVGQVDVMSVAPSAHGELGVWNSRIKLFFCSFCGTG
jgi:hypothetical protein